MHKTPRSFPLILVLGLLLLSTCVFAQTASDKPSGTQTLTGCVQKGVEPSGGFFLLDNSGKHWELYDAGNNAIADHVGQKVTVTGTIPKRSAEEEKTSQPFEKQETGKRQHGDFQVSSLKVVSQTCGK